MAGFISLSAPVVDCVPLEGVFHPVTERIAQHRGGERTDKTDVKAAALGETVDMRGMHARGDKGGGAQVAQAPAVPVAKLVVVEVDAAVQHVAVHPRPRQRVLVVHNAVVQSPAARYKGGGATR